MWDPMPYYRLPASRANNQTTESATGIIAVINILTTTGVGIDNVFVDMVLSLGVLLMVEASEY